MDYPICLNPNCKSHGKSHPNCMCHQGMAKGGAAEHFCSQSINHEPTCQYFADGGDVGFVPDQAQQAAPADSLGFVPDQAQQAASADSLGFVLDDQQAALQDKYGTPGQQAISGVEGLAKGLAGPLATSAEKALGVDPEDEEGRAAANPITHGVAEAVGFAAPALLTGGEYALSQAGVLGQVGHDVAGALGAEGAVGTAVKLGVENSLFALGDEVSKAINNNPDSIQTAAVHVGLSGLLGAGVGYPLGKASEAWVEKFGPKAEAIVKDFTDRLKQSSTDLEAVEKPLVSTPVEPNEVPEIPNFPKAKATPELAEIPEAEQIKGGIPNFPKPPGVEEPLSAEVEAPKVTAGQRAADFITKKASDYATTAASEGLGYALGKMTGLPFGGAIGAILGQKTLKPILTRLLPTLIKPILESPSSALGLKAAAQAIAAVAKGEALLSKAAEGVFTSGTNDVVQNLIPDQKTLHDLDLHVQGSQMNPNGMMEVGGDLGHYMPQHQTALAATAQNAVNYISSSKPRDTQPGILNKPIKPSLAKEEAYTRTLSIAEQPLMVMHFLKQGNLKVKDVQDLQSLYPALHQQIIQKLNNAMIGHLSKGEVVPFKIQIGLSRLMGQPLNANLTPQSIMAAQLTFAPPPPPQQQGPGAPKRNTNKLGKTAQLAQTPSEARQAALSKA